MASLPIDTAEAITVYNALKALIKTQEAPVLAMFQEWDEKHKAMMRWQESLPIRIWIIPYLDCLSKPSIGFTASESEMEKFKSIFPHPPWIAAYQDELWSIHDLIQRLLKSRMFFHDQIQVDQLWDGGCTTGGKLSFRSVNIDRNLTRLQ